jgi:flavin-binding protein dodecin
MPEKIKIKSVIEIVGAPKEHVEETMREAVNKVKDTFKVTKSKIYEAEQIEKFWSTFTDFEMELKDINQLIAFCFDFMPSSIEILEPDKIDIKQNEVSDLMNDLLARLHQYDMILKNLNAQVRVMEMDKEK